LGVQGGTSGWRWCHRRRRWAAAAWVEVMRMNPNSVSQLEILRQILAMLLHRFMRC
jgi:hypothetical protein